MKSDEEETRSSGDDEDDGFVSYLMRGETVKRALKVAAIVGTLLVAINQGDMILSGMVPPWWKILLTYCVPYAVSSYSTAAQLRGEDREG